MAGRKGWAVAVVAAAFPLVVSACVAPGSTPSVSGEHFAIPAMPFPAARSFALDPATLDDLACAECEATEAEGRAVEDALFYGDLPLASVDQMHGGADARTRLGQVFASGYFGGLYLRDSLPSIGAGAEGSTAEGPSAAVGSDLFQQAVEDFTGALTHAALDTAIGGLVNTARTGSPLAVRATSAVLGPLMALIHGYNRGYLQVAIENPPAGAQVPDPLSCTSFFSCRTSALPMEALGDLADVADELADPRYDLRRSISGSLHDTGASAVAGGREVWEGLLGAADFDAGAYDAIIDLSYGFLQVTEVALLGVFEGAAGNTAKGRSGIVAAAALLLWSGSYFLGLAADAPADERPMLTC